MQKMHGDGMKQSSRSPDGEIAFSGPSFGSFPRYFLQVGALFVTIFRFNSDQVVRREIEKLNTQKLLKEVEFITTSKDL